MEVVYNFNTWVLGLNAHRLNLSYGRAWLATLLQAEGNLEITTVEVVEVVLVSCNS